MPRKRRRSLGTAPPETRLESAAAELEEAPARKESRARAGLWSALSTLDPDAGRPLDASTRSRMEGALGGDLSDARVHTDAGAARAADDQDARAFTVGSHVAFAAGEYRPGTPAGDGLLAHELAHVQQQRGASAPDAAPIAGADSPALEADADRAAVGAAGRAAGGWVGRVAGGMATAGARMASGVRLSRCKKSKPWKPSELEETLYEQGDIEAPIGDLTPPDAKALMALRDVSLHVEDTKEEVLEHLTALNAGDSFVFFGHGAELPEKPGVAVGINPAKGKTIMPADLEGALKKDANPPSLVMLSGCGSASLLKGVTDSGVPVAVGFSKQINAPSGALATVTFLRAIHDGKTFGDAEKEAAMISTGGDRSQFQHTGLEGLQMRSGLMQFADTIVVYGEGYGPNMTLKDVQEQHKQEMWEKENPDKVGR